MKKLFTFILSSLVVLAGSAEAATPQVVLTAPANYDISINGRMYSPNPTTVVNNLAAGTHTVELYRVTSGGIFGLGKKRELLSRQQFNLRNNDVNINVDQYGRLRVSSNGYNSNGNYGQNGQVNNDRYGSRNDSNNRHDDRYENRNGNNHDRHDDRYDNKSNDRKYGKSEGKGKGHKYGHYKNDKKNKHKKDNRIHN